MNRHYSIDLLRATAIVLMLIFHFFYDMNFLGIISIDISNGLGWQLFRGIIVSAFLLAMGASLTLAFPAKIIWPLYLKRLLILAFSATVISIPITLQDVVSELS